MVFVGHAVAVRAACSFVQSRCLPIFGEVDILSVRMATTGLHILVWVLGALPIDGHDQLQQAAFEVGIRLQF